MGLFSTIGAAAGTYFGGPIGGTIGGTIGGMLDSSGERSNVDRQAAAQEAAAREAAAAGRFRPIGVTTRFGKSNFTTDAKGNITEAGYQLTPELLAQQNQLMGLSGNALQQYAAAQQATAPMGTAAQGLMGLGQGYLATTPQQQAAKFMADQQSLLAPTRAAQLSTLQNKLFQQGRTGLAVGGEGGMMATNPEMAAYYNALAQQDRELAAQATQGGMEYARFGAGLLGTGGNLLQSMYGTQAAAFDPYKTALGGAQSIEGLGQQAMDIGVNIGAQGKASPTSQQLLSTGLTNAANLRAQAGDPWSGLLSGVSQSVQPYIPQITNRIAGMFGSTPQYGYSTSWGE